MADEKSSEEWDLERRIRNGEDELAALHKELKWLSRRIDRVLTLQMNRRSALNELREAHSVKS